MADSDGLLAAAAAISNVDPVARVLEVLAVPTACEGVGEQGVRSCYCQPPHMPRRGAPQAHGPASAVALAAVELEEVDTAKTESNCSTLRLWQLSQTTFSAVERTIFSNWAPHSRQRYSKIGIRITPRPALSSREFDSNPSGPSASAAASGQRRAIAAAGGNHYALLGRVVEPFAPRPPFTCLSSIATTLAVPHHENKDAEVRVYNVVP